MLIVNIILITLLIAVFQKPTNYLMCGIFAWVGKAPKYFSAKDFNVLGNYNDSRGGDSCGVYRDGEVLKGMGSEAKYETLVIENELHSNLKLVNPVVIGHTRKVSSGTISLINAQPIVIVNNEGNIIYTHAHNGTVYNYSDLAREKPAIELTAGESDSVALALLIENRGFDILRRYEGSAALVMHFTEQPNTLYAFHGKSKTYAKGVAVEEKPLYYLQIPGKGTYISSLKESLRFISPNKKIIPQEFEFNYLYKLEGDVVEKLDLYDRADILSERKTVTYTNPATAGYNSGAYRGNMYLSSKLDPDIIKHDLDADPYVSRIRYTKGAYYLGKNLANGELLFNNWGYVSKKEEVKSGRDTFVLYFFHGIPLIDKASYDRIQKEVLKRGWTTPEQVFNYTNFHNISAVLKDNAIHPFCVPIQSTTMTSFMRQCESWMAPRDNIIYFTGSFSPLFSKLELTFNMGDLISKTPSQGLQTVARFKEDYLLNVGEPLNINYTTEEDDDTEYMTCPNCSGDGYDQRYYQTCVYCDGEGRIEKTSKMKDIDPDEADEKVYVIEQAKKFKSELLAKVSSIIEDLDVTGYSKHVEAQLEEFTEIQQLLLKN